MPTPMCWQTFLKTFEIIVSNVTSNSLFFFQRSQKFSFKLKSFVVVVEIDIFKLVKCEIIVYRKAQYL